MNLVVFVGECHAEFQGNVNEIIQSDGLHHEAEGPHYVCAPLKPYFHAHLGFSWTWALGGLKCVSKSSSSFAALQSDLSIWSS